jgi:hypothetical protein
VREVVSALRTPHRELTLMWETWWQANRAMVFSDGPLTWVLTFDGHRLAGSYPPFHPTSSPETRSERALTFEFALASRGVDSAIHHVRAQAISTPDPFDTG